MPITAEKFYRLFLKKIDNKKLLKMWLETTKYTDWIVGNKKSAKDCVMEKLALDFGLKYCHEYFQLDGIFYRKQLSFVNKDYLKKHKSSWYAKDIEVIIEHENNFRGIKAEIYKLIPLYVAPLKVIITYLGGWRCDNQEKIKNETEKIKRAIDERIKNDDIFALHKNKIETLLLIGSRKGDNICWQGFIFKNNKIKELK